MRAALRAKMEMKRALLKKKEAEREEKIAFSEKYSSDQLSKEYYSRLAFKLKIEINKLKVEIVEAQEELENNYINSNHKFGIEYRDNSR